MKRHLHDFTFYGLPIIMRARFHCSSGSLTITREKRSGGQGRDSGGLSWGWERGKKSCRNQHCCCQKLQPPTWIWKHLYYLFLFFAKHKNVKKWNFIQLLNLKELLLILLFLGICTRLPIMGQFWQRKGSISTYW